MQIRNREQVESIAEPGSSWSDSEVEGRPMAVYLPGVSAGFVGFAVFLILHAIWIVPIWFIIPIGLVMAGVCGAVVGWAYETVSPHLPPGLLARSLSVAGGTILVLTPSTFLFLFGDPTVPVVDGIARTDAIDVPSLAGRFVLDLLVVTGASGAIVGWLLTRRREAAVAMMAAGVAFALGPGHNLPFFHLDALPEATRTGLLLMLASIVSASLVLVLFDGILERRGQR